MRLKREKLEILHCLRFTENREAPRLDHLSWREQSALLLWLDQSGLALYLLDRLRQANAVRCLPENIACRLEDKLEANRKRTGLLVEQLAEVVSLLEAGGIPYAVMKGFSLSPEFCSNPVLRHQTDIDLLLARKDVAAASTALESCGYSRIPSLFEEEFVFSTPLRETPSRRDNIYAPRERKIEIHVSLWDPVCGIAVDAPELDLKNVSAREVMGVKFCALPLEQAFLLQLLHVFRHFLGGWIRPSWVYELGWFLGGPRATSNVCASMLSLIPSPNTVHACGLCLSMATTVFRGRIPSLLEQELLANMPEPSRRWAEHYAERFLLSDISGTKLGLLVERAFAIDPQGWRTHLMRRMLPFRSRPHLGTVQPGTASLRWRHRLHEAGHFIGRLKFHITSGIELGWEAFRAFARMDTPMTHRSKRRNADWEKHENPEIPGRISGAFRLPRHSSE
jgi:hypothetical protein